MKHYLYIWLAIACFVTTSRSVSAQKIHFSDTTNKWKVSVTMYPNNSPITYKHLVTVADSFIEWHGQFYAILLSTNSPAPVLYVREDTLAHKVYVAPILPNVGIYNVVDTTTEFTYMDYTLSEGDTFTLMLKNAYPDPGEDSLSRYYVGYSDSILVGTNWHRRFYMHRISGIGRGEYDTYTMFEGLGFGRSGQLGSPFIVTDFSAEYPPQLECFSNLGVVPIPPFYYDCFDPVGIEKLAHGDVKFSLFPNPATGTAKVFFSDIPENHRITVTDLNGRELISMPVNSAIIAIDLENLHPGMYFVQLKYKGRVVHAQRLVRQ